MEKPTTKYMKDFEESKPSKFITYLDANNLYGWAMSQNLPIKDFEWMNSEELKSWENQRCILEVDLIYQKNLHDLHNDYPLAPERMDTGTVEKLIPNLHNKEKYVLHCDILKQYLDLGLRIRKIHRGIKFKDSNFLKS